MILSKIYGWLAAVAASLGLLASVWFVGYRNAMTRNKNKTNESEIEAHERINNAETGVGATDADRIKRLQQMGNRWRDR
jgi:hypothetical protein